MEISLLVVAILGFIAFRVVRAAVNAQQRGKALLASNEYLGQRPHCQTGPGIRC